MTNKSKSFPIDLIEDFVVLKSQDSPNNFSASRDAEQIDAHSVTKDGDIQENNIDAHSVTNDGDINEITSDNVDITNNTFHIENVIINSESRNDANESSSELDNNNVVDDLPEPDLSFEFGG